MMIKSIDINNYHGIEKLHLDLEDGMNLLIGNNGAGKTSLLNALAAVLQEPVKWLHGYNQYRPIENTDAFVSTKKISGTVMQETAHYPVSVDGILVFDKREFHCDQMMESAASGVTSQSYDLTNIFRDRFGDASQLFPILCFLQAGREKVLPKHKDSITIPNGEVQRIRGYHNAFNGVSVIDDIQQWCVQMEFAEYQRKQPVNEYQAFKQIVSDFMSMLDITATRSEIYYSSVAGDIIYNNGSEEKPLYLLSAGYQAVLCMIIELAYRAVILNPAIDDLSSVITGTALIDEIDIHLHPAWQWKILDALRKAFPKVQFIIATHSPIILSSAENTAIYLMNSPNDVIRADNVYGYEINDVLSLSQGTGYRPEKVREYYEKAESILDHGDSRQLDDLLRDAREEFKDAPFVYSGLSSFVEINRWVEEA